MSILLIVALCSLVVEAKPAANNSKKPEAAGKKYFLQACATCHGADAGGGEGPSLHNINLNKARIAAIISSGFKGEMPSFSKRFTKKEIDAIAMYVQGLRK